MGIKVTEKTDYSYLFNSFNQSSSGSTMNGLNLSDYASIKNGSYGKLLKAYYTKENTEKTTSSKKDTSSATTEEKKLTTAATDASALQSSAEKLINKSSTSLFKEKDITTKNADGTTTSAKGYDTNAIYNAVSDFTAKYNTFIKAADDTTNKNVLRENKSLTNLVSSYKTSLNNIGITIQSDNTLSIDETKFKAADMTSVKSLFNGNTSFAYSVSTKASMIGTSASSAAKSMAGYNNSGNYSDTYSTGNLLNSIV